jgi:hypothetical protein
VALKLQTNADGVPVGIDREASATRMYQAVEVHLRKARCAREQRQACRTEEDEWANLPAPTVLDSYEVWTRHGASLDHARALVAALTEAFENYVRPVKHSRRTVTTPTSFGFVTADNPEPVLQLLGRHSMETLNARRLGKSIGKWAKIDPAFAVDELPPYLHARRYAQREYSPLLQESIAFNRSPLTQGFYASGVQQLHFTNRRDDRWRLGVMPTLVFAQEALRDYPALNARSAPSLITRAVGETTVAVRYDGNTATSVAVEAPSAAPFSRLVVSDKTVVGDSDYNYIGLVTALGRDDQTAITGESRATAAPFATPSPIVTDRGDGIERRRYHIGGNTEGRLLALSTAGASGRRYIPLPYAGVSYLIGLDGRLSEILSQSRAVRSSDWSSPQFDRLGLPTDWVPPADAQLLGGVAGEESYQYFLRKAKESASEASDAVRDAVDVLVKEATDTTALEATEATRSGIGALTNRAACGNADGCSVPLVNWMPTVPLCPLTLAGTPLAKCQDALKLISAQVSSVKLASEVVGVPRGAAPRFAAYGESDVSRVLVRQLSAKRAFEEAINAAGAAAAAAGEANRAAAATETAANERYEEAVAHMATEVARLDASRADVAAGIAELRAKEEAFNAELGEGTRLRDRECDPDTMADAVWHGYSYSWDGVTAEETEPKWATNWSPGTLYSQKASCTSQEARVRTLVRQATPNNAAIKARRDALLQLGPLDSASRKELVEELELAEAERVAAKATVVSQEASSWSQFASHLVQVQAAMGEALAASVELGQVLSRAEDAKARANLEAAGTAASIKAQFALRRQYQSQELWRARALLEATRRLAQGARRAIEARFVVKLSSIEAPQAFVSAPALWADDVFADDLAPPSVVGLAVRADDRRGVYPNQIVDYVNNLERFVQGYTTANPTSVAPADSEVITIPGPFSGEPAGDAEVAFPDSSTAGWLFFCPTAGTWVSRAPEAVDGMDICGSEPPSKVRYSFSLDPYGRLDGDATAPAYEMRHNVRWGRFALNLTGTGIRDCSVAPSISECAANPYLRYALSHAGPAWVTDTAQRWAVQSIPTAHVEGGKVLAAEEWLDPVMNSWNQPFISNIARSEFVGRPIGGAYQLEFQLPPGTRPEMIEELQLLIETSYWVRQN